MAGRLQMGYQCSPDNSTPCDHLYLGDIKILETIVAQLITKKRYRIKNIMGIISKRYFHDIKKKNLPSPCQQWCLSAPPPTTASVSMELQAVLETEAEFESGTT